MEKSSPYIILSNGLQMPVIGLGTSHDGGYSHESVTFALKYAGYTHIDTAARYRTEKSIGEDIKASGVHRDKLFITTKVWPANYGYEETKKSLVCSLADLNIEYVDLYLMHWPDAPSWFKDKKQCLKDTWKAMEELYRLGKCKAIGVSNFLENHLTEMFTYCSIKPHLNQIEFHPYCYPKALIALCEQHNIVIGGYCPLAKGEIIRSKKLRLPIEPIAKHHKKSIAQVVIRWSIQHNIVTIPKSTKVERVSENIDVFDFHLNEDEMTVMDALCDVAYIKATWDPEQLPAYQNIISN